MINCLYTQGNHGVRTEYTGLFIIRGKEWGGCLARLSVTDTSLHVRRLIHYLSHSLLFPLYLYPPPTPTYNTLTQTQQLVYHTFLESPRKLRFNTKWLRSVFLNTLARWPYPHQKQIYLLQLKTM